MPVWAPARIADCGSVPDGTGSVILPIAEGPKRQQLQVRAQATQLQNASDEDHPKWTERQFSGQVSLADYL